MFKKISANKWCIVMMLAGVVGCMTLAGCFKTPSMPPPAKAAAESTAKAVPAAAASGGASVGAFLQDIGSATAGAVVSEHMSPFFLAGLGLVILGGLTMVFGGKATGFTLIALGMATTGTGVLFIQYPWVVLVIAVVIGVLVAVMAYTRNKDRQQLEGTAAEAARQAEELDALGKAAELITQVVETVPGGKEVKAGLRALGTEKMAAVKKVVSPIKEKLALAEVSATAETARL
jgi:membrane protein implicated in regulation of membrane protease activity